MDCNKQKVGQMNFLKGVDYTVTVQSSSQWWGGGGGEGGGGGGRLTGINVE